MYNIPEGKEKFNNIKIPEGLDYIIDTASSRAHRKKKLRQKYTLSIACLLITFIMAINISPTFAATLERVPGVSRLVDLFKLDSGIETVYELGYMQEINKFSMNKHVKFTVNYAAIDRRNLVIAYTIESDENYSQIVADQLSVSGENSGWQGIAEKKFITMHSPGKWTGVAQLEHIDFSQIEKNSETINIEFLSMSGLTDNGWEVIKGDWNVSFKMDKHLLQANPFIWQNNKEYAIGDNIIRVNRISIYPTTTEVEIDVLGKDLKSIDGFKNIHMKDGAGNKYKLITANEFVSEDKLTYKLQFESSYFAKTKELQLVWEGLYLRDKNKRNIVVDLKNRRILDDGGLGVVLKNSMEEVVRYAKISGGIQEQKNIKLDLLVSKDSIINQEFTSYFSSNEYMRFGILSISSCYNAENNREYGAGFAINRAEGQPTTVNINVYDINNENPSVLRIGLDMPKVIPGYTKIAIK